MNLRGGAAPVRRRPAPCCEPVEVHPAPCCERVQVRPGPCREPVQVHPAQATGGHEGTVALVGNPNVGKSTLFNALTGARQHVGNWPGKTVHVATGTWRAGERTIGIIDLPGTYSLLPRSPDEELTRDLLVDRDTPRRPDVAVVVVDAANLARNLYLLAQVLDTGVPAVVALTMLDVAAGRGIEVDPEALSRALRVPVVAVQPRRRRGGDLLASAVVAVLSGTSGPDLATPAVADLGEPAEAAIAELTATIRADATVAHRFAPRWLAMELLTDGPGCARLDGLAGADRIRAAVPAARHRLLSTPGRGQAGAGTIPDDPDLLPGDPDLLPDDPDLLPDDPETLVAERRYAWVHEVLRASLRRDGALSVTLSDRVDRVLTSRWFGVPIFLAVMWGVFVATTRLATPLQGGLQGILDGPVRTGAAWLLTRAGAPPGGFVAGLVLDGLVAGVGQLLTFVPLMAIMFVLLAVLEDSGYLARAAFVVDRFMRLVGLPGRAFLPLVVGFGCNVPAIAGTRILSDTRQRLLTTLLVPYVTCSARLTVYLLLGNVFFGSAAGTVIFAMYLLSIALVILIGLLLRRTLFRGHRREPLILELPPYRRPTLRVIGGQTWQKLAGFLRTASGIIVVAVTAVWLLSSIPAGATTSATAASSQPGVAARPAATPVSDSVYGVTARAVAPVFAPAGYGDWHATAALMTGFVAKEAVVATFAQTYSAAQPPDARRAGALGGQLRDTFRNTSGGHTPVAVLAFLVFLLAYTPCVATVAAQRHEIGTRWTLVGMAIQLGVAWLLSVLVFQVGSLLW